MREAKFLGRTENGGEWYRNSYIELCCKIIASIARNIVYTPFSVLPKNIDTGNLKQFNEDDTTALD